MNKKYFLLLLCIPVLIISIVFAVWVYKDGHIKTPPTTETTSQISESFETVTDNGSIDIKKEYTIDEVLKIKTNWNPQYSFPCESDSVEILNKTDTEITYFLSTDKISFNDTINFYNKYTKNKQYLNTTSTRNSFFFSFQEDFVSRTISIADNGNSISITIVYSLENTNKR